MQVQAAWPSLRACLNPDRWARPRASAPGGWMRPENKLPGEAPSPDWGLHRRTWAMAVTVAVTEVEALGHSVHSGLCGVSCINNCPRHPPSRPVPGVGTPRHGEGRRTVLRGLAAGVPYLHQGRHRPAEREASGQKGAPGAPLSPTSSGAATSPRAVTRQGPRVLPFPAHRLFGLRASRLPDIWGPRGGRGGGPWEEDLIWS